MRGYSRSVWSNRLAAAVAASAGLHALALIGLLPYTVPAPDWSVQSADGVIVTTEIVPLTEDSARDPTSMLAMPEESIPEVPTQEASAALPEPTIVPKADTGSEAAVVPPPPAVLPEVRPTPRVARAPTSARAVAPSVSARGGGAPMTGQDAPPVSPAAVAPVDPGWHAAIIAWLHRNKVYPPEARASGEEGTGQVRFTVTRDGTVLSVALVEGTGSAALDAALRRLFTDARLPAFPPVMTQEQVSLRVRVSYGLGP